MRTNYSAADVDAIGAYCAELDELLPDPDRSGRMVNGGMQLRLAPARNRQRAALHFAEQYLLGAVAQLEERCPGTAEVGGSNPLSSTPSDAASVGSFNFLDPDRFADLKETVGMDEFYAKLAEYVRRAQAGEEVLVTRWGTPVAKLGPAQTESLLKPVAPAADD